MIPKIKIKQDGTRTFVYVDGKQLHGIRAIHYDRTHDSNVPILKLDMIASDMEIDGYMIPKLPEIYEPYYKLKKEMKEDENE